MGKTDPFLSVVKVGFGAAQLNAPFQAIHHPIILGISNRHSWHANQSEALKGRAQVAERLTSGVMVGRPGVADLPVFVGRRGPYR
jgi:hypothetical protein